MIDSRRWPRCTATRSLLVAPGAGGVRAAVRDPVGHDVDQLLAVGLLVAPGDAAHLRLPARLERRWLAEQAGVDAEVGALLVAPGQLLLDPRPADFGPASRAAARRRAARRSPRRSRARRWARRRPPPWPAETRVSRRSKATTGSSNAMYSMVLFIVDTSFSGFFGSGDRPTSAVDRIRADDLVGRPAGELHVTGQAELVAQRHQVVEAVARADQGEGDVVAAQLVHDDRRRPARRSRRRPAVPSRRCRRPGTCCPRRSSGRAGPRRSRSGVRAGAHDGDRRRPPCRCGSSAMSR